MTKTFEKAAETYRFNAKVQQKTAENIMSMCSNVNPKVILDIGCGSGILTEKISKNTLRVRLQRLILLQIC